MLAGTLLCLSCKPSAESAEQPPAPTRAVYITKICDTFVERDVETMVAHMNPGHRVERGRAFPLCRQKPLQGPRAIVAGAFGRIGSDFDNFRLEMTQFHNLDADGVLVTGRHSGTYKATGKEPDAHFAHLWKLKDTPAASFQQYTYTWQARQAATPDTGENDPGEELGGMLVGQSKFLQHRDGVIQFFSCIGMREGEAQGRLLALFFVEYFIEHMRA